MPPSWNCFASGSARFSAEIANTPRKNAKRLTRHKAAAIMFGKVKTGRVVRICCIQESGAFGASFACGRWMNGTREPRGKRQFCQKPRRIPALSGNEAERIAAARSFNQGGTAGFPSLSERNLLFLYRFYGKGGIMGIAFSHLYIKRCEISGPNGKTRQRRGR